MDNFHPMTLKQYMEQHNLDDAAMAKLVGEDCTPRAIRSYRYFGRRPRPERMLAIQLATRGKVTLKDWSDPP